MLGLEQGITAGVVPYLHCRKLQQRPAAELEMTGWPQLIGPGCMRVLSKIIVKCPTDIARTAGDGTRAEAGSGRTQRRASGRR